eukprot:58713-Alexandrium_andersonii.AAC.1
MAAAGETNTSLAPPREFEEQGPRQGALVDKSARPRFLLFQTSVKARPTQNQFAESFSTHARKAWLAKPTGGLGVDVPHG